MLADAIVAVVAIFITSVALFSHETEIGAWADSKRGKNFKWRG